MAPEGPDSLLPPARFLPPAAATLVFVAMRLFVGLGEGPETSAAGLGGDVRAAPARVVAQIAHVREARAESERVPETEGELLELLRRKGTVLFTRDEVDVIHAPARRPYAPPALDGPSDREVIFP